VLRVLIIAVGKVKDRGARSLLDDYLGRIGRYARVTEVELKDGPDDAVAERFARAVPERCVTVALEVEGEAWSSRGLAEFVGRCEGGGTGAVAFLIGGSYGLPAAVSRGAAVRVSLSPMTLPHRLCRVLLAEQLYRAFTLLRGEPYSH
jgi:23S rRNA (pseudouridine1915-N3)-methyltransferase